VKKKKDSFKKDEENSAFKRTLKHLGLVEAGDGLFHHFIGTDNPEANRYMCVVDLKKKNEGHPHIHVDMIMKDGSTLSRNPTAYGDLKQAAASIVKHFFNKSWE
jgi:hypothetical protein